MKDDQVAPDGSALSDGLGNIDADYSTHYIDAIEKAQAFFAERLPALPDIHISHADFHAGTDALRRHDVKALVSDCFEHMLTAHKYELSYSQQCRAFFGAAGALKCIHVA